MLTDKRPCLVNLLTAVLWLASLSQATAVLVPPLPSASAADVNGRAYDLVVVGGTPGGIACAVRAAREGLTVLLVQHNRHVGGMLSNGLMQWDALYAGHRAPLFNEYARLIESHYRESYGAASPQYRQAQFTQAHYPLSRFEPSVAELLFSRLVSAETNLTVLLCHYPAASAAQYFGTKGFFADYNARLDEPLTEAVAGIWRNGAAQLREGRLDPARLAADVWRAERAQQTRLSKTRGAFLLRLWNELEKTERGSL